MNFCMTKVVQTYIKDFSANNVSDQHDTVYQQQVSTPLVCFTETMCRTQDTCAQKSLKRNYCFALQYCVVR